MRLLQLRGDDGFSLVERVGEAIPPYAILSHTWGADTDEVTFKDLIEGTGTDKVGYEKLTFCGKQAASDGLGYFWVDTCCIDKSSSAELTEAINSMFQWYRNSTKCYVYLTDVSSDDFAKKNGEFKKSRWFTRGWTLQELVAPKTVDFFSSDQDKIGNKNSMVQELYSITGITPDALHGTPLSRFSIDERMAWAARRNTKREEDRAYCLLGLFGVSMSPIYGEGQERAFVRLRKEIADSTTPHVPQSTPASAIWNVPFLRNRHFVGQEVYLNRLEALLFAEEPPPAIAITGLGGMGKTQIAIELAHRMRAKFSDCSIFWLPATSTESLQQGFTDIAQLLKVYAAGQEDNATKKAVQRCLSQESTGKWLLILDNVDDMDMWSSELKEYIPRSRHGCVVCTTRSRKVAVKIAVADVLEMSEMEEQTGLKLLSKSLIHQELLNAKQDAQELLTMLAFLPLAITQAAAYVNENGVTLSKYLSLLRGQEEEEVIKLLSEEFEDMGRYQSANNPIATTWLLSFEQMRCQNPLAAEYLSFMSCVDTKAIPKTLLPPAKTPNLEADALGTLSAYYFVTRRSTDNTFDVHRLVHLAMRNWLRREGTLIQWTVSAILRLEEVLPHEDHEREATRTVWRSYLPHARSVLDVDLEEEFETRRGNLLQSFAQCLFSDGRYSEAETSFSEVSQLRQRVLGDEHQDTLISKRYLAQTYLFQGRFYDAEELGMNVLETSRRALGDDHITTLDSKEIVADTYVKQRRRTEAENLHSEVLQSRKRLLGEEHIDTVHSKGYMAEVYRSQRRWKEAEELHVQVMKIHQTQLGKEHPYTLISMNNLALTYLQQRRLVEAEEMYKQIIHVQKRVFGERHPEALTSLANLADTYAGQKRWEEAEEIYKKVIETSRAVRGEKHHLTVLETGHLAELYREQCRWKEAEDLSLEVVQMSVEVLGNEHRDTLAETGNLALVYLGQGRFEEAEKLEVRVLEVKSRVLGEKDLETLTSMFNLAYTWKYLNRDEEAIALMERCLELMKEVLGPEDTLTKRSLACLKEWRSETSGQDDTSESDSASDSSNVEEQNDAVRKNTTTGQEETSEQDETSLQNEPSTRTRRKLGLSKLYRTSISLVRRSKTKAHD